MSRCAPWIASGRRGRVGEPARLLVVVAKLGANGLWTQWLHTVACSAVEQSVQWSVGHAIRRLVQSIVHGTVGGIGALARCPVARGIEKAREAARAKSTEVDHATANLFHGALAIQTCVQWTPNC